MSRADNRTVTFKTALAATGNNTGIVVPGEVIEKSGAARLSNSLQRYHVDNINGAKASETRQRRIDKAISLFGQGKQR